MTDKPADKTEDIPEPVSSYPCAMCGTEMKVIKDSYLHSAAVIQCPECGYQSYG